ncbi:MAG: NF038143 family protein [Peptococcales bacterium]|jgi:hypothetical protein
MQDKKYQIILNYEKKSAHQITMELIEKPEISSWMFLVPIVFVPYLQRLNKYKNAVKIFEDGYLFTKKQALDVAYLMYKDGKTKNIALDQAKKVVIKDPQALEHIQKIYSSQLKEICLLADFYYKLFQASGNSYEEMLREVHPNKATHQEFLNALAKAEHEVNNQAIYAVKINESERSELFIKLEEKSRTYRLKEAERIYNSQAS